jgi:hypothetical protein
MVYLLSSPPAKLFVETLVAAVSLSLCKHLNSIRRKNDEKIPGDPGGGSVSDNLGSTGCQHVGWNMEVQRREVEVRSRVALQKPDGESGNPR